MEVMQCGLNWNMMIQKREIFRQCFDNFDFDKVASYGEADIERILDTEGMIHSRRKTEAVIHNARCFQKIRDEFGSFSDYIWEFTEGKTYLYTGHQRGEVPARNGRGIINDHLETCFRYQELLDMTDAVRKRRDKEQ